VRRCFAHYWRISAANLGCARWSKRPTPEEEGPPPSLPRAQTVLDQRTGPARQPDQRAALRARVSGTSRCAANRRQQLNELRTACRPLPSISRPRSAGSSIGSNCCSSKSRRWRLSGTRCLPAQKSRCQGRRPCYWISMASGPNSPRFSWSEGLFRHLTIGAKLLPMQGWRRRLGKVDPSITSREFRKPAILDCGQHSFNSPGYGCAISRNPRWLCGLKNGLRATAAVIKKTTIVALARKLLVALWKYVTAGVVIEGAVMKTA